MDARSRRLPEANVPSALTQREKEILDALAKGLVYKETAVNAASQSNPPRSRPSLGHRRPVAHPPEQRRHTVLPSGGWYESGLGILEGFSRDAELPAPAGTPHASRQTPSRSFLPVP